MVKHSEVSLDREKESLDKHFLSFPVGEGGLIPWLRDDIAAIVRVVNVDGRNPRLGHSVEASITNEATAGTCQGEGGGSDSLGRDNLAAIVGGECRWEKSAHGPQAPVRVLG